MTAFECFSPAAMRFLRDLKVNNDRDWFAANKDIYEREVKLPASRFADALATELEGLTGQTHVSKIFRIHRDVRFSKDKSPYNAHLHMAFTPGPGAHPPPMWFFGLSPERLSLGCGVFQYDKDALIAFRQAMAGTKGAELCQLTTAMREAGVRVAEPDLKRVPPGFDKDHPNAQALRRKGFSAWIDDDDPMTVTKPALAARSIEAFRRLLPVFRLLNDIG